jgi:hypothetical protein
MVSDAVRYYDDCRAERDCAGADAVHALHVALGEGCRREEGVPSWRGFAVVDVPTREEALVWAAKIAVGCRCAQEVRKLMPDPETDEMIRRADRRG